MSELRGIVYDARTVRPGMTGVGRFALNLLAALNRGPGRVPLRAFFAAEALETARRDPQLEGIELLGAPSHERHPAGDLWLRFEARKHVRPGEAWLAPAYLCPAGNFPRAVAVHDLFAFDYPRHYPLPFRWFLRLETIRAMRCADLILCGSDTVRRRIDARFPDAAGKTRSIWYAGDRSDAVWGEAIDNPALDYFLERGRTWFLAIGDAEDPRKNARTAAAGWHLFFQQLRPDEQAELGMLIAGGGRVQRQPPAPGELERTDHAWPNPCGAMGGAAKARLLENAYAFVSASLDEGFGLPVVEAMQHGRPLILSNIAAHREIAGEAALYFDPEDHEKLRDHLFHVWRNDFACEQLGEAARERGRLFSWDDTARETLAALRELV